MPLLKLKLGGDGRRGAPAPDPGRVPRRAPDRRRQRGLDARAAARAHAAVAAETGFELIEQPLPAGADEAIWPDPRPVPVCADESLHTRADLDRAGRPLRCRQHQARQGRRPDRGAGARRAKPAPGASRSWSAAWSRHRSPWRRPMLLAQGADWVDLDGPLLLARDRDAGAALRGRAGAPACASALGLRALDGAAQDPCAARGWRQARPPRWPPWPSRPGRRRSHRADRQQHGAAHGDAAGDGSIERLRRAGLHLGHRAADEVDGARCARPRMSARAAPATAPAGPSGGSKPMASQRTTAAAPASAIRSAGPMRAQRQPRRRTARSRQRRDRPQCAEPVRRQALVAQCSVPKV